jgi:putative ATP-dependent endonuclease of OLD family
VGDDWMVPFGQALGMNNVEFEPWKEVFFDQDKPIMLVEGDTDKEYLELLRRPEHGANRLKFPGEICVYQGKDNLRNSFVMKFLRDRCKRLFITFDLDAREDIEPRLIKMGFTPQKDFLPFGIDLPGTRDIEGLLPDSIKNAVRAAHSSLVDQLASGEKDESREAKAKLKRLYLDEFRTKAKFTEEFYRGFYDAAKKINRLLVDLP